MSSSTDPPEATSPSPTSFSRPDPVPSAGPTSTPDSTSSAPSTESSQSERAEVVLSENRTRGLVHNAAWRKVALCYLLGAPKAHPNAPRTLAELYRLLGWTEQQAYQRRRYSTHIQLRIVAQMAEALRAPVGQFCEEVAMEEGIPPVNQRVIHKPKAQRAALEKLGRPLTRCHRCGGLGHRSTSPRCPMAESRSESLLVMQTEAAQNPTPHRPPRKPRDP
jgi:hypothetical protein